MDIESLRCFIAVVETGSYTRAAKQVHRSQSAVSQKMHKLAQQADKTLFIKAGRALELTEDGKFLLSYARHIISLYDEAMGQMRDSQKIDRPLRLGCPDDYAENILPKVVASIQRAIPNLPLQLYCTNSITLNELMTNGELDAAIVSRSSPDTAGHYLEKGEGTWAFNNDIEHIARIYEKTNCVPLVLFEQSCHFHHAAIQGLSQQNINSRVVCSSNSVNAIQSLVMAGHGLTVVADCSIGRMLPLNESNNPLPFKLPKLPSVMIEMVIAAKAHPNFGRAQLKDVVEGYAHALMTQNSSSVILQS